MKITEDGLLFETTGRRINANNEIIGINPNGDIYEGYDRGIDSQEMTPEEREELANYMISLWNKFKTL